jgi:cell wall-associated NlpC family hydrolase
VTSTIPRAAIAATSFLTAAAACTAVAVATTQGPGNTGAGRPVSSQVAAGLVAPAVDGGREPASATRSQHRRPLHPANAHADRHRAGARHANRPHRPHRSQQARPAQAELRKQTRRVLAVARAQRGKPYVWGAAGPRAFDCSGYVQWVYRHALGKRLPKYTDTQWAVLKHISRRELRPGDLVFVGGGRHKSHVGIYAGHWEWWVAPRTGSHVKKQRIWPATHTFARVVRRAH